MRFWFWRVGSFTCALAAWAAVSTACGGGKLVRQTHRFEVPQGESLRVTYRCNGWMWGDAYLLQGTNERQRVYWWGQKMQEGGGKAGGVQTNYENYGVHFYAVAEKSRTAIPCLDVRYWLMPNFHNNALYDHAQVTNSWRKWHEDYPLADRRVFVFDFRYDRATDRTYVYLDNQYDGTLKFSGQLTGVEWTVAQESDIVFESYPWKKEDACRLPKLFPSRASRQRGADGSAPQADGGDGLHAARLPHLACARLLDDLDGPSRGLQQRLLRHELGRGRTVHVLSLQLSEAHVHGHRDADEGDGQGDVFEVLRPGGRRDLLPGVQARPQGQGLRLRLLDGADPQMRRPRRRGFRRSPLPPCSPAFTVIPCRSSDACSWRPASRAAGGRRSSIRTCASRLT